MRGNLRMHLAAVLSALVAGFGALPALAQTEPFDISDPTARDVVIFVDDNSLDPTSLGNDLQFAFTGSWTSDGSTGTIVVPRADVISASGASGTSGTPIMTESWSDLVYTIDVSSGDVESLTLTGFVDLPGCQLTVMAAFDMELNTTGIDAAARDYPIFGGAAPFTYLANGFDTTDLGIGCPPFNLWCSDQINPAACPSAGPGPFPYQPATGRFNAIGGIVLELSGSVTGTIPVWGTFGDAQLFEVETLPTVPTLSIGGGLLLAVSLLLAVRRGRPGR